MAALVEAPARQRPRRRVGAVVVVRRRGGSVARARQPRLARGASAVALDARALDRHDSRRAPPTRPRSPAHPGPTPTDGSARSASCPDRRPCSPTTGSSHAPPCCATFAVAHGDSYVALPGGLARAGHQRPELRRSRTRRAPTPRTCGCSSTEAARSGGVLADGTRAAASPRRSSTLPARAAEHLFWLGRYAERAEATVRLIRTINARRDEFENAAAGPGPAALTVLLEALTRITGTYPGLRRRRRARRCWPTRPTSCSRSWSTSSVRERWRTRSATCSRPSTSSAISCRSTRGSSSGRCSGTSIGSPTRPTSSPATIATRRRRTCSTRCCTACCRWPASRTSRWCAISVGSSWRPVGASSARSTSRCWSVRRWAASAARRWRACSSSRCSIAGESIITVPSPLPVARASQRRRSTCCSATAGTRDRSRFQLDRLAECLALLRLRACRRSDVTGVGVARRREPAWSDRSTRAGSRDIDDTGYRADLDRFVSTVRTNLSMISDAIGRSRSRRLASAARDGRTLRRHPAARSDADRAAHATGGADVIYEVLAHHPVRLRRTGRVELRGTPPTARRRRRPAVPAPHDHDRSGARAPARAPRLLRQPHHGPGDPGGTHPAGRHELEPDRHRRPARPSSASTAAARGARTRPRRRAPTT